MPYCRCVGNVCEVSGWCSCLGLLGAGVTGLCRRALLLRDEQSGCSGGKAISSLSERCGGF